MDNRHPWRSRSKLLAFINAVAGAFVSLGVVAVVLGVTDNMDGWTSAVSAGTAGAVGFVAWLADIGIVRDGEAQTTPVADPLGPHGDFMVEYPQYEALAAALAAGDYDAAAELAPPRTQHEH